MTIVGLALAGTMSAKAVYRKKKKA
ncbi:hypothetical protein [Streptococcus ruminantium]